MSTPNYRHGNMPKKKHSRKVLFILAGTILLAGLVATAIYFDLRKNASPGAEGADRSISQKVNISKKRVIDEPYFKFEMPADWKETGRNTINLYTSISWQSAQKGAENRYLSLYIDRLPVDMPVNRLVAVASSGSTLTFSDVSENCASFTVGGTFETRIAATLKPARTKWNKVDFICNLPRVTDNEVGTGSEGSPNSVSLTGEDKGTHKYFFVYTDRSVEPDYKIFYDVLRSFTAK